jgi:hypothetical protein
MFAGYLPHSATISRLAVDAGANTQSYQVIADAVPCFLQPMETQESVMVGLAVGQGFRCYLDISADIKPSDKVVIDGEEFRVNGLNNYNYGYHAHKRASLVREQ